MGREIRGTPAAAEVYARADDSTSLRQLDAALGYSAVFDESNLRSQWYHAISSRPLGQLDIEDLAFALREGIHLPMVLPLAIARLSKLVDAEEARELGHAAAVAARMVRKTLPDLVERTREVLRHVGDKAALALLDSSEEPKVQPPPGTAVKKASPRTVKSPYQ